MANPSYQNGAVPGHDHLSVTKAIASKKAFSWIKSNWLTLASVAIAAGALWILPVTRWQLDDTKRDIFEKISSVQSEVDAHRSAIADIKSTVARVEDNTTKILFKLSDPRPTADPAPIIPASSSPLSSPSSTPPEKPKPKAKRPHPQRIGLFQRLTR